jgi:uncharacterized protein with von Willebrand factor type A (vWA) domain
MDERISEFVRGMRAAGVRVSVAESADALRAVELLGVTDKELFRQSLRTTLIKASQDFAIFDRLFPLYFGSGGPPMENLEEMLSEDEQDMLRRALESMSERMRRLMEWLTSGDGPTKEELEEMAQRMSGMWRDTPYKARWVSQRMLQEMGFNDLPEQMAQLAQMLQEMGMSSESMQNLLGVVEANEQALREQVAEQAGLQVAQDRANRPDDIHGSDLMHKSFEALTDAERQQLRLEVRRIITQLRSRAALRRRRGNKGKFDAKGTVRSNLRYGGVPIELKFKQNKLKPNIVLILDVSQSMRNIVEFMLRFMYELHDQISKMHIYLFYTDLSEIETDVLRLIGDGKEDAAFERIREAHPYIPYGTDLGNGLETLYERHMRHITGRTTVMIVGDGRNNFNASRSDLVKDLGQRAKQLIWLNPESEGQWSHGDSDMLSYQPYCDDVWVVRNLAQLSAAVDKLLGSG